MLQLKVCLQHYCFGGAIDLQRDLRGCSYGSELAQLGGLAHLGEIFIPRSCGIFCLSSIKKFVKLMEKDCLIN